MSELFVSKSATPVDSLSEDWIDLRLISAMRLMLASCALMVVVVDPLEPNRYVVLTYTVLTLYNVYSAIFYFMSFRHGRLVPVRIMPWLDMCWYIALVALTNGANSIFFNFFFFAILVASFGWGYVMGLYLTLVSAILFTIVGILTTPSGPQFGLNRLLLRPILLLVLGYLIARWGGFKMNLRNRLRVLKDVTIFSNPRFGIDRTIRAVLESLLAFYDADSCLLLISGNEAKSYQLYRVNRGDNSPYASPQEVGAEGAAFFIQPFQNYAVIHHQDGRSQKVLLELGKHEVSAGDAQATAKIAAALETDSYLSVPVHSRQQLNGRLYVIGGPRRFDPSAIDFVAQLMDQVTPLIENIRLVDNLASDAADEERRRIARDIHDSVIQPYLGLQLGIAALVQKLEAGNTDVLKDVKELLELTDHEMLELRRYVWDLRVGEERRDVLLPAIRRYVARFASVTGINVEVKAQDKIEIKDRLAAELFQIVTEGLSNVRRHALCNEASVEIRRRGATLILQIRNRRTDTGASAGFRQENNHQQVLFTPRSISERAALLGGEAKVSVDQNNYTVVSVAIPL